MSELKHITNGECLMDIDYKAWETIRKNRGSCCCHVSPPCFNCSEPESEEELNSVGYTYEKTDNTVNESILDVQKRNYETMTKRESLEILLLLSSIEAWSLNATPLLPDYLHDELSEKKEQLTNFILSEEQQ